MEYAKSSNREEARKALHKQLREVAKKYGKTQDMRTLNMRVSLLASVLGYPEWRLVYYPSGVYDITMKSLDWRYDYFAIYVRKDQYEVRFHDGFFRGDLKGSPREVKEYLERK